jgi:HK97 family phage portal protein
MGLSSDGRQGYGVVQRARESIGLTQATERYGAGYFGHGAKPGGVLEHPTHLSDKARDNLRASWNELHKGLEHSHRLAILEEGLKYHAISNTPEDSQFLETRQFQVVEVARWFNLPPHILRDLTRATFSNIEHQGLDVVTYSLRPWAVRWETELWRKLLSSEEKRNTFFEFDFSALLRGDMLARYQAYGLGRDKGFLSVNDIRQRERMTPIPKDEGGDIYIAPVNYQSLENLKNAPAQPVVAGNPASSGVGIGD